jgi:hypothetical protein
MILWPILSSTYGLDSDGISMSTIKDTLQAKNGIPRIETAPQAIIAAQKIFITGDVRGIPPQVLDVKLLPYREAIKYIGGVSIEDTGSVRADTLFWVVIFLKLHDQLTPPSVNPSSPAGECIFVFVDPQTGNPFQSGSFGGCHR